MPFIYVRRKRRRSNSTYRRRPKRSRRYGRRYRVSLRRRSGRATIGRSRSSKNLFLDSYFAKIRANITGYLNTNHDYSSNFRVPGNYLPGLVGPSGNIGTFVEWSSQQLAYMQRQYKWYRVFASKIYLRIWNNAEDQAIVKVNLWPAMDTEESTWNSTGGAGDAPDTRYLEGNPYAKTASITPFHNTTAANTVSAKSVALRHYMTTDKVFGDKSINTSMGSVGNLNYANGAPAPPADIAQRWSWYFNSGSMFDTLQWAQDGGWPQSRQATVRVVYYVKFFGRRMPNPTPTVADI